MKSRHEYVTDYLLDGIQRRLWTEGNKIPSENELVKTCQVSRMTARKAIKALEARGLLYSVRGKGTYITPAKSQSSVIELRNIAEEVRDRDHEYDCDVIDLKVVTDKSICERFSPDVDAVYYSVVVHKENGKPIQVEHRYVNPKIAADYLSIDLQKVTANEYLTSICPVHELEHQIEAVTATSELVDWLALENNEPCLLVSRLTWFQGTLVSYAKLYHPGNRFILGTKLRLK